MDDFITKTGNYFGFFGFILTIIAFFASGLHKITWCWLVNCFNFLTVKRKRLQITLDGLDKQLRDIHILETQPEKAAIYIGRKIIAFLLSVFLIFWLFVLINKIQNDLVMELSHIDRVATSALYLLSFILIFGISWSLLVETGLAFDALKYVWNGPANKINVKGNLENRKKKIEARIAQLDKKHQE